MGIYGLEMGIYALEIGIYALEIGIYGLEIGIYALEIGIYALEMGIYALEIGIYTLKIGISWALFRENKRKGRSLIKKYPRKHPVFEGIRSRRNLQTILQVVYCAIKVAVSLHLPFP